MSVHYNAQAGPSSIPDVPAVFLPLPGPPLPRQYLHSTQDLLGRFGLSAAYDKYVMPHAQNADAGTASDTLSARTPTATNDKGKGKDVLLAIKSAPGDISEVQNTGGEEDGEQTKGEKKQKNSYKHLIRGIPGKHSTKKDEYLQTMMQMPPKQKLNIRTFDAKTQSDAFTVSLEGLKGWSITSLIAPSAQAREDRKKRKELKKLAKAQMGGIAQTGVVSAPTVTTPTVATPSSSQLPPSIARHSQPFPFTSSGTPRPAATNGRNTRPSTPSNVPVANGNSVPRPSAASTPSSMPFKGKKRELEDGAYTDPSTSGSRARPMKRPKTDTPIGLLHSEMPQQQPTPQGV